MITNYLVIGPKVFSISDRKIFLIFYNKNFTFIINFIHLLKKTFFLQLPLF